MTTRHLPLLLTPAWAAALIGVALADPGKSIVLDPAHQSPVSTNELVSGDTGVSEVSAKNAAEIRRRMTRIVNNASTVNGFDDLISNLSKANRDHLAEKPFRDYDRLNAAIAAFRDHFKSSVGKDFDCQSAVFDNLKIYAGFDPYHALVLLGPDFKADLGPFYDSLNFAGAPALGFPGRPYGLTGEEKARADEAGEPRDHKPGTLHEITLNFANEGILASDWRLQLLNPPADAIATAIIRHLTILSHDTLPKDPLAAHRLVARHLLTALVDSHAIPKVAADE